jgi:AcrR family transcriptional regulator
VAGPRADVQRNRAAIVEAAVRALARDPAATMDDVAAEARLGRATVFRHFRTRDELVRAAWLAALGGVQEELLALRLDALGTEEALPALARFVLLVGERYPFLFRGPEPPPPDEDIGAAFAEAEGVALGIVVRAQREGVLRDDVPGPLLAEAILRLVQGGLWVRAAGVEVDDLEGRVLALFLDGARQRT